MPQIVNKLGEWYHFPVGIAYISSKLRQEGFNVTALNLNNIDGSTHDILKQKIDDKNINVVLTGGLTGQYGTIYDILYNAKQINSSIITIVGGGIITSDSKNAMKALKWADYGVIGEGELISCDLCFALENNENIKGIPGIIYKNHNTYIITKGNPKAVDLERLPLPDYKGFEIGQLLSSVPNILGMSEYNTLPIVTSRSCPYRCTFCFHPSGTIFRQRSLDSVFQEIDFLVKEFGVKFLSICDELFSSDKERLFEFCKRIKPYSIKWLAQFRVADINPETISLIKEANCAGLGVGIESADNKILKSMKKNITIEQTEYALQKVYDAGIGMQGNIIFGDVAETIDSAKTTLNWWKKHFHFDLHLSFVVTYPGTELYKIALQKGLIPDPVKFIKDGCPIIRLSEMTDEEYLWLLDQVLILPRLMLRNPQDAEIKNIDYSKGTIDVYGKCNSCMSENKWNEIRLFILDELPCKVCGQRHRSPIPEILVKNVAKNTDLLIKKYGDVAFWGINSYFYAFVQNFKPQLKEKIHFLDKSDLRCGLNISGYTVKYPNIIKEKNIKCVIVSVVKYYSNLKIQIKEEYPEVEQIISITELLS